MGSDSKYLPTTPALPLQGPDVTQQHREERETGSDMQVRGVLGGQLAITALLTCTRRRSHPSLAGPRSPPGCLPCPSLETHRESQASSPTPACAWILGPIPRRGSHSVLGALSTASEALRSQETFKGVPLTPRGPGCHWLWAPACPQHAHAVLLEAQGPRRVARGQGYLSTCHPCCA